MLAFNVVAFDEFISGTLTTWYTSADYHEVFGTADQLIIYPVTTDVSPPSSTLTCQIEHSGNSLDWVALQPAPEIDGLTIANDTTLFGAPWILQPPMLKFVRIKLFMGGTTSPQCRLKLHVVGRVHRYWREPPRPGAQPGSMQARKAAMSAQQFAQSNPYTNRKV